MDNPRELVREFRRRHKLTQVELARLMARTSNYISMVERGDRPPSEQFMAHLELLDRILTVEPDYRNRAIIKESPEDDPPPLATIVVHPSKIHRSCQEATLMPRIDDALERLASLPPIVPLERWYCCACDTALMTHAAFSVHMQEQHNVTPAAPSAHVLVIINECADHVAKVYAWTLGGVEAEQYLKIRRNKDSLWDADMIDLPAPGYFVTDAAGQRVPLLSALAALGLVSDGGK